MTTASRPAFLKTLESTLLIVLLWAGMLLPFLDNLFSLDPSPDLVEKRDLAPPPHCERKWSIIKEYPKAFDEYFKDHFGFRRFLTSWVGRRPRLM